MIKTPFQLSKVRYKKLISVRITSKKKNNLYFAKFFYELNKSLSNAKSSLTNRINFKSSARLEKFNRTLLRFYDSNLMLYTQDIITYILSNI